MKRAVIYTRVSTDEQAKNGLSLQGQEASAKDYCKREGFEVAAVFCDAGESAKTANRPQLIASIAYCKDNYKDIDYYVVWKMDRFSRMAIDSAVIDAELQKMGIQLRSVTEPITDSPIGNLTKTMLAGFAQFDNEVRGERSMNGVRRRIEEGGWPHMAPLGYINCKDVSRRPTLIIDEHRAPIIAKWFREYLKGGYTQQAINQLAWDMGIKSRAGKRIPNQQTINMLRNPIYAGLVYSKMLDAPIKGLHEGIITFAEHEAIVDKLDGRKKPSNRVAPSDEWPLRNGFIKCADCGESITGSSPRGRSKSYPMYHCPKCRAKVVGHRVSVAKDKLESEFEELLESVTPTEAMLKLFRYQVVKKWQDVSKGQIARQKELQRELERLTDRRQRVLELFIDGNLSSEEKILQTNKIDSEIFGTNLKLNDAKGDVINSDVLINFGINMIQNASKLWRIASEIEKQRLQAVIFPEGLIYDFKTGFGTAKLSESYLLIQKIATEAAKNSIVVGAVGVEPTTKTL